MNNKKPPTFLLAFRALSSPFYFRLVYASLTSSGFLVVFLTSRRLLAQVLFFESIQPAVQIIQRSEIFGDHSQQNNAMVTHRTKKSTFVTKYERCLLVLGSFSLFFIVLEVKTFFGISPNFCTAFCSLLIRPNNKEIIRFAHMLRI